MDYTRAPRIRPKINDILRNTVLRKCHLDGRFVRICWTCVVLRHPYLVSGSCFGNNPSQLSAMSEVKMLTAGFHVDSMINSLAAVQYKEIRDICFDWLLWRCHVPPDLGTFHADSSLKFPETAVNAVWQLIDQQVFPTRSDIFVIHIPRGELIMNFVISHSGAWGWDGQSDSIQIHLEPLLETSY